MNRISIMYLLAGDSLKASSRVRGYWIIEELNKSKVKTKGIVAASKKGLILSLFYMLFYHTIVFQKVYSKYHVILAKIAKRLGKKVIFDIDDYPYRFDVSVRYTGFERMLSLSDHVLCGGEELHKYVESLGFRNSELFRTPVKLSNYKRLNDVFENRSRVCIGWIGNGLHYEQDLVDILYEPLRILSSQYSFRLKIIGSMGSGIIQSTFERLNNVELVCVEYLDWSDNTLVSKELSTIDIGVYPLLKNNFNRFKCGFKALEYFAMKLPVIASKNLSNSDIVSHGENGYLVTSKDEWILYLEKLINDGEGRIFMGENGYRRICQDYATEVFARNLLYLCD